MNNTFCIITAEKSLAEYSDKLKSLLREQGNNVHSWTLDEYKAVKFMTDIVAEDSKLLFMGENSDFPRIEHWQYENFGCRIGWRGDVCILFARPADLPYSEYKDFREYCIGLQLMHEDVIVPPEDWIEEHAEVVMDFFGKQGAKTAYYAQYSTLIYEFIGNYVDKFINASDYIVENP
jgi:hypothetical protein